MKRENSQTPAAELGDYRWKGYSLAQKQAWMRDGRGRAAVEPGLDLLNELSGTLEQSHDRLRTTLAELGVHWSGSGASAARGSLRGTVDRAGDLHVAATGAGAELGRYGDSFAQVKLRIPGPMEIDAQAGPDGDLAVVNGLQADLRGGPASASRANQEANVLLVAHERTTRTALAEFPIAKTQSATADLTPTGVAAASGAPGQDPDDSHHRDDGAFSAMPMMPPVSGADYRSVPSRPCRLPDPNGGPFRPSASSGSTAAGGLVSQSDRHAVAESANPAATVRDAAPMTGKRPRPFAANRPTGRGEPLPPPVDRRLPRVDVTGRSITTAGLGQGGGAGAALAGLGARLRRSRNHLGRHSTDESANPAHDQDYVNKIGVLDQPEHPKSTPGPAQPAAVDEFDDSEFDAEFDRELGMDLDQPPVGQVGDNTERSGTSR